MPQPSVPAATVDNPVGLDGFAFVEFASPDPEALGRLFSAMGFAGDVRPGGLAQFVQGDIRFLVNDRPHGPAAEFHRVHGPSACAMGFRVRQAAEAAKVAQQRGARRAEAQPFGEALPAFEGIGGSLLYLVDEAGQQALDALAPPPPPAEGVGLHTLDHLTHNLARGRMDAMAGFYERVFGFREIRHFDIRGQQTGLFSRAMTAPDDRIRIPLNESQDELSQIEEFLRAYNGEGIQHIALATDDILRTVDLLRARGIGFQDSPDSYFDRIDARLPGHGENVEALRRRRILIDGAPETGGGLLLQIFTENAIGPIFFEIIQRKGNEGFGEGNFQALFESLEEDQRRRGALPQPAGHA